MMFSIRIGFEDGELAALYEIEKDCFTKKFRWAENAFNAALLGARKRRFVWVARDGDQIAGFLLAGAKGGKASIETVNVPRAHRRKGVASKLIAACEKSFRRRGFQAISLEVWTENPAQILYFNLGYRACGFSRDYYKPNANAVSMSKKL